MVYRNIELPDGVCEQAYNFTKRLIDSLDENMVLSPNDELSFYLLCNSYNQYIKASEIVAEKGLTFTSDRGNVAILPEVKIMKDCHTLIMNILKEMSGTIRSRSVIKQIAQETEDSPLEQFLKGRNQE